MYSSETFYSRFAKSYAQYATTKQAYLSSVNTFIKQEAGTVKTMVDVGSGDGKRSKEIANLLGIDNFTLIDNSDGMVNLSKNIPGATILKDDISNAEFKLENKYDVVLCLWNVLGHIVFDRRVTALKNLVSLVNDKGVIFLDVNNRYNAVHYGIKATLKNICKDILTPKISNGDFELNINTDQGQINTIVHIFNPNETKHLFKLAGLKVLKTEIINYKTGEEKSNFWSGQLIYKLAKI